MTSTKGLDILILDTAPDTSRGGTGGHVETWRGGATDRATRAVMETPARWLVLADVDPDEARPQAASAGIVHAWRTVEILRDEDSAGHSAGGVILVSMDVDPDKEEEFNDWYDTEHIPLLRSVPGVHMARRFRSIVGSPKYVALYHVADVAAYDLQSWKRANETPWIMRMRRFQRNRTYFMFPNRCETS